MRGLHDIDAYCPHFCHTVDLQYLPIHRQFKKHDVDPFTPPSPTAALMLPVVFMEYIVSTISDGNIQEHDDIPAAAIPFAELIENEAVPFHVVMSVVKQVLMALYIAQRDKRFVHYDLHCENILLRRCPSDEINVYRLDTANVVAVPTFGYIPVIIDYGNASSTDLDDNPMCCALNLTTSGYLAPAFDPLADMRVFLISISYDIQYNRFCDEADLFRNFCKHTFKTLRVDWSAGWVRPTKQQEQTGSIADQLLDYMEDDHETSAVWTDYAGYAMDILHNLVVLPLTPTQSANLPELRRGYTYFMQEFRKVESEIHDTFVSLYVLHHMVREARSVQSLYADESTRAEAVSAFGNSIFTIVRPVVKFCRFRGVQWEVMLCALYVLQEQLGGHMFALLDKHMAERMDTYRTHEIPSLPQIIGLVDLLFPLPWQGHTDNTTLVLYDTVNRETQEYQLEPHEWAHINSSNDAERGTLIWEFL